VTGWTLPMQMGVQVAPVLEPVAPAQRAALQRIEQFTPPEGHIDGTGSVLILSHKPNNSFKAINQILAGGGHVSFAGKEIEAPEGTEIGAIVVTGGDRERIAKIVRDNSLVAKTAAAPPKDAIEVKKPRLGLYRAWVPLIDEGWSRWILENYDFNPVTMRNGDMQAGDLRDHFDAIILPDTSPETLRNGFGPGTIRGEYTGGIGVMGVAALRDFIQAGGILITFNNASLFAIDDLGLAVKNVLAGLKDEQFFCSGSLLRLEMQDSSDAAAWGLPHDPIVMFERGPAFEPKEGFRGRIIAAYPKEQSPLMSGYLLHPEKIQGKAAAMEVQYGKGRVYLFGFRPQWRGQSHGTYQFIFNAIYESQGLSKPAPIPVPPAKPPATAPEAANQPRAAE
jgi:hypothetical protein